MMPEAPTGSDLGAENASARPDNLSLSTFISSNCGIFHLLNMLDM
jgi:hypothetical protein